MEEKAAPLDVWSHYSSEAQNIRELKFIQKAGSSDLASAAEDIVSEMKRIRDNNRIQTVTETASTH